ncbi:uncharacterized protein EV422DRAFT_544733 [Fimicolochytrium jonesii]|uniref:uncharacterized protein n=1 Tax=Fimicolochytrium jonesii TaxID=1396493 RepID=UPI0022FDE600|nr:uncharacterized protein EV422DRAFT_544733 [Fimicolochytrium jonesii]KAI8816775.1 hypothetical protein EV422DRAFT_544733 [Fimicolochytrium jonesii]
MVNNKNLYSMTRAITLSVVACLLLAVFVNAQPAPAPAPAPTPLAPASPAPSGATPSVSASGTARPPAATGNVTVTPSASASTTPTPSALPLPPCGSSQGQFNIIDPNPNQYGSIGNALNVTWGYSDLTDRSRFPAKKIALYYQRSIPGPVTADGWVAIDEAIPPKATSYQWIIPSMQGGTFLLHIAADDIDPQRPAASTSNCIPDTFPGSVNSRPFKILTASPLTVYPDSLAPNSAKQVLGGSWSALAGAFVAGVLGALSASL